MPIIQFRPNSDVIAICSCAYNDYSWLTVYVRHEPHNAAANNQRLTAVTGKLVLTGNDVIDEDTEANTHQGMHNYPTEVNPVFRYDPTLKYLNDFKAVDGLDSHKHYLIRDDSETALESVMGTLFSLTGRPTLVT